MRIVRVKKSNTKEFQGYNKEPFVIYLDEVLTEGTKIRRKGLKVSEDTFYNTSGSRQRIGSQSGNYLTVLRLLNLEEDGVFPHYVKHNNEIEQFSWPKEDLAEWAEYEVITDPLESQSNIDRVVDMAIEQRSKRKEDKEVSKPPTPDGQDEVSAPEITQNKESESVTDLLAETSNDSVTDVTADTVNDTVTDVVSEGVNDAVE